MNGLKKNRFVNILSYVLIGIVFTLSLAGIIIRFNKGTVYLFNTRADVVLSSSMSAKNEEHLDFLEGHDDQYQKFDLVFSQKVKSDEDVNVYDVIIYKNPMLGTTMHRVVGKTINSVQTFYLREPTFVNFNDSQMIQMNSWASGIITNSIPYESFEVVLFSQFNNVDSYTFSDGYNEYQRNVETKQVGDYYEHRITASNLSSLPRMFVFNHKKEFDYSKDYLSSITLTTTSGEAVATADKFTLKEEGKYEYSTNYEYNYEIRGDNVKDSDGTQFKLKDIYSKVSFRIPGGGYFVRFITSIYGIILLIGMGFIIIGANFLIEYDKKKKQKIEKENNGEQK